MYITCIYCGWSSHPQKGNPYKRYVNRKPPRNWVDFPIPYYSEPMGVDIDPSKYQKLSSSQCPLSWEPKGTPPMPPPQEIRPH